MALGRPVPQVLLASSVRHQLVAFTRSRTMAHPLVRRAKITLLAAGGLINTTIADKLGLSKPTVGLWRKRFLAQGLVGLYDELRLGGPRSISDRKIAALIRKTLKTKPKNGTHWTCRSIAAESSLLAQPG